MTETTTLDSTAEAGVDARPIAVTDAGLVAGRRIDETVSAFLGIPFAEPPIGALRWHAPVPVAPWHGVRSCDAFGASAPQSRRILDVTESEDCLSLNVWTGDEDAPRPVLVWIHGGRFGFGSSADPVFDGAALARAGLVVVTFNYRLGVFGFLAHPELSAESGVQASGNYGLLDQIAALEWVQRNIAAFGGDPDRVTVAGQSAGAASVLHLVNSPLAEGLFTRAIALSGARHPGDPALAYLAPAYRLLADAEAEGVVLAAQYGADSIDALREIPWRDLVAGTDATEGHRPFGPPLYRPVLDGHVVTRTFTESLEQGPVNDVPVITGTTSGEDGASPGATMRVSEFRAFATETFGDRAEAFLALYPATTDDAAARQRTQAARDAARVSTYLWASLWRETAGSAVFTSYWTHVPPGPEGAKRGAYHESELPYLFGNPQPGWQAADASIAARLASYLVNFAADGDPNGPGLPPWRATRPGAALTTDIGERWAPVSVATDTRLQFWRTHFERGRQR